MMWRKKVRLDTSLTFLQPVLLTLQGWLKPVLHLRIFSWIYSLSSFMMKFDKCNAKLWHQRDLWTSWIFSWIREWSNFHGFLSENHWYQHTRKMLLVCCSVGTTLKITKTTKKFRRFLTQVQNKAICREVHELLSKKFTNVKEAYK